MTKLLRAIYFRLDMVQHTLWFKVAASVLAVVACISYFGVMVVRSHSMQSQRIALYQALANQNLEKHDEHAVSLNQRGVIELNGRTYGGESFKKSSLPWFDEHGNMINIPYLVEAVLAEQIPSWAPRWLFDAPSTTETLGLAAFAWVMLVIWFNLMLPAAMMAIMTWLVATVCLWLNAPQMALTALGIGVLTFTFLMLTRATLVALAWPAQVCAVAHTLVKEASRIRVSQFFIIVILVLLPILPQFLDPTTPLRFRIQSFISWSVGITFVIAACMTLCLSCASVAFEIRDRQIWQLMTKPVGRLNYLLGKWVGVMVVNLNLMLVASISTFSFIQYMRSLPVAAGQAGQVDALAVRDEVLTARLSRRPEYQRLEDDEIRKRVEHDIANDPNFIGREVSLAEQRRKAVEIQQQYASGQRIIAPGPEGKRLYTFSGLGQARELNSTLTLKYRFHINRDDEHEKFEALFVIVDKDDNIVDQVRSNYVPTMAHSMPVPTNYIQDDGTLRIGVINLYNPPPDNRGIGAMNFEEKDFELMYKVGNFEDNFLRAALMNWLKLAFLAALGICGATFLSFPVACLASFTIFIAGSIGPFLAESLEYYGSYDFNKMDWSDIGMVIGWAFETVTATIATMLVYLLGSFGEYHPTQDLVEGLLIPWTDVGSGFLRLVVLWSGMSMLVGWLVMRKRQLAIYSGQG